MIPTVAVRGTWLAALAPEHHAVLARAAAAFVATRRFFRRGAAVEHVAVEDVFVSPDETCALLVVRVGEGESGVPYTVPVRFAPAAPEDEVVARVSVESADGRATEGALVDAAAFPELGAFLVALAAPGAELRGTVGRLRGDAVPGAGAVLGGGPRIRPLSVEQSHSMLRVGERAVAKLLRALDPGDDTELEVGRFLAGASPRPPVPALLGWVRLEGVGPPSTVLVVSELVENEGTAFERFCADLAPLLPSGKALPAELRARVELLAERTVELHRALASSSTDAAFAPEPFDAAHGEALGAAARALLAAVERDVRAAASVSADARRATELFGSARVTLDARLSALPEVPGLVRIRCHGDYHLGQVLSTGGDFVVVDLGGEPLRDARARRVKHCALRDVAGMLRSFDYALETASREVTSRGVPVAAEAVATMRRELEGAFLDAYLEAARGQPFVPTGRADVDRLLALYVLEKCVYEVGYELAQRPAWLPVPVAALERIASPRGGAL